MHKPSLLSLAILGSALAMPLAFAQDAPVTNAGDAAAPVSAATTEATVEGDVVPSDASVRAETDATATTGTSAPATAGTSTAGTSAASGGAAAAQVTWADLDADNDGSLSRTEATPLASLVQVFDDADADADGKLTPDEYRAFVAANDAATGGATGDDGEG